MPIANKMTQLEAANWFAFLLLFIILGLYGREIMEWALLKLYEIFIQGNAAAV